MSEENQQLPERMLTPAQAAAILGVDPKTVTRWASNGQIRSTRTAGNHRRYRESDVYDLRDNGPRPKVEVEEESADG